MAISDDDLERLRRCVALAREALDDGDHTRHPEFADTIRALYEAKFRS